MILSRGGIGGVKDAVNQAMKYCLYDVSIRYDETADEAADRIGINYGDLTKSFMTGQALYESFDERAAKTSVSKTMLFDFYSNRKTDFEIITFIAFAAIRSILQRQKCVKMTNEYLLSRMSGNNKIGPIASFLQPYNNRYQLDKIRGELEVNWGLKVFSHRCRGFYVSFKMGYKELAVWVGVAKAKKEFKRQQIEKQKQQAIIEAKAKVQELLQEQYNSSYK